MKKFLGILFLLIVAAFGVCAYFFPGLPYYYKTKHEFRETGSIWYELPDKLPELSSDSYDLYSSLGLRITAWKDMEPVHTEEKDAVMWGSKDTNLFVSVCQDTLGENYDFLDMTGIDPEDLENYCKKAQRSTPQNKGEFVRLAAMLTMDDIDLHSSRNAKTFYKIMNCKNDLISEDASSVKFYPAEGVGFLGFIQTNDTPDGQYAFINIYPERDKKHRYILSMSVTDWDEVIAIAQSIQLTE